MHKNVIVLALGTLKDGPNATGLGISKMANMRLCYAYFHQVKSVLFCFIFLIGGETI